MVTYTRRGRPFTPKNYRRTNRFALAVPGPVLGDRCLLLSKPRPHDGSGECRPWAICPHQSEKVERERANGIFCSLFLGLLLDKTLSERGGVVEAKRKYGEGRGGGNLLLAVIEMVVVGGRKGVYIWMKDE